ncbi:MAG: prepilin-type N-terminal cleavage/methylation domain-containing protein [Planctomycetes bacterium]|nr:prepilin-type N-terminal cleavage/methylation domain-containing protein [Planctomycetota bacterium]
MKTMRRDVSGFSLIELMMAMTILAVALLALMAGITHCIQQSEALQQYNLAMQAAQSKLEEIQAVSAEDLDAVVTTYNADPADDPDGEGTAPGSVFAVTGLIVTDDDADGIAGEVLVDDTDPDLLAVTVQVVWQGPTGAQTDVTLLTLLTHQ